MLVRMNEVDDEFVLFLINEKGVGRCVALKCSANLLVFVVCLMVVDYFLHPWNSDKDHCSCCCCI